MKSSLKFFSVFNLDNIYFFVIKKRTPGFLNWGPCFPKGGPSFLKKGLLQTRFHIQETGSPTRETGFPIQETGFPRNRFLFFISKISVSYRNRVPYRINQVPNWETNLGNQVTHFKRLTRPLFFWRFERLKMKCQHGKSNMCYALEKNFFTVPLINFLKMFLTKENKHNQGHLKT